MRKLGVKAGMEGNLRQISTYWRAAPKTTFFWAVLTLVAPVLRFLLFFSMGELLAALLNQTPWKTWAVILTVVLVVEPLLEIANELAAEYLGKEVNRYFQVQLARTVLEPQQIDLLEDPNFKKKYLYLSADSREWFSREGTYATISMFSKRAFGLAAAVYVAWWHPLAMLILLTSLLIGANVFAEFLRSLISVFTEESGGNQTRAEYFRRLNTEKSSAREMRLFGLQSWSLAFYMKLWQESKNNQWRERRRILNRTMLITLFSLLAAGIVFSWLLWDLWHGLVSAGLAASLIDAMDRMEGLGPQGDWSEQKATQQRNLKALEELQQISRAAQERSASQQLGDSVEYSKPESRNAAASAGTPGGALGVEINDLHFSYPGSEEEVLKGLNLSITPGENLAIVGLNGCGKSTLIKLLSGLYQPTAGTIMVGGQPATQAAQNASISVMFQDFPRYHLSLAENIYPERLLSPEVAEQAVKQLKEVGAQALVERIPDPGTVMNNAYENGTDLSGGQWQRVALARTLSQVAPNASGTGTKTTELSPAGLHTSELSPAGTSVTGSEEPTQTQAGLIVLDEPTAALDVRVEAELFADFRRLTQNQTTILVSHRLSTVRHADRIVVIDGGQVSESGTHAELLAAGGLYAQLFQKQSEQYLRSGTVEAAEDATAPEAGQPAPGDTTSPSNTNQSSPEPTSPAPETREASHE
ncbi:ABC transporter ATP-binding protein [Boudabousia liubingyangii]|uniref:ABC transporter ATP-binding protein n=1 Tax=Boudabousia liubingyangii TaxID=1921764 RepID=UPI001E599181|nr:ABC transporter ATP-binding protein [Boudabousia liubingyangii]